MRVVAHTETLRVAGVLVISLGFIAGCSQSSDSTQQRASKSSDTSVVDTKKSEPGSSAKLRAADAQFVAPKPVQSSAGRTVTVIDEVGSALGAGTSAIALPEEEAALYITTRQLQRPQYGGLQTGDPIFESRIMLYQEGTPPELYEEASTSMAVSTLGKIAYNQGSGPILQNIDYHTQIIVRDSLTSDPVIWLAAPDKYEVIGWAGSKLVVVRIPADMQGGGEYLLLEGPEKYATILEGGWPLAISADGSEIAYNATFEAGDPPLLKIWDVSNGTSEVVLPTEQLPNVASLTAGAWVGDQLYLEVGRGNGSTLLILTRNAEGTWAFKEVEGLPKYFLVKDLFFSADGSIGSLANSPAGGQSFVICDRQLRNCTSEQFPSIDRGAVHLVRTAGENGSTK